MFSFLVSQEYISFIDKYIFESPLVANADIITLVSKTTFMKWS